MYIHIPSNKFNSLVILHASFNKSYSDQYRCPTRNRMIMVPTNTHTHILIITFPILPHNEQNDNGTNKHTHTHTLIITFPILPHNEQLLSNQKYS